MVYVLIAFLIAALIVFAAIKHWRHVHDTNYRRVTDEHEKIRTGRYKAVK